MTTKTVRKILGYVPIVDAAYVQHLIEKAIKESYNEGKIAGIKKMNDSSYRDTLLEQMNEDCGR